MYLCVGLCDRSRIKLLSPADWSSLGHIQSDADDDGDGVGVGVGVVAVMSEDDRWGLICDDWWNDHAARLICTCLGFQTYDVHFTAGFFRH